jgi:hypothetical protein
VTCGIHAGNAEVRRDNRASRQFLELRRDRKHRGAGKAQCVKRRLTAKETVEQIMVPKPDDDQS